MYAMLNTKTTMNPSDPLSAEYGDEEQVVYVLSDPNGKMRVLTSFGELDARENPRCEFRVTGYGVSRYWKSDRLDRTLQVGDPVWGYTDQTNQKIQTELHVVGINFNPKGDDREGVVPNRKLKHWVCK